MQIIGIVAGTGELPLIVAHDAKQRDFRVVVAGLQELASSEIQKYADVFKWINPGKLSSLIDFFHKHKVTQAIFAGKVPKTLLYKAKVIPDLRAAKLLFALKDRSDDSIMNAVREELKKEGIEIIDTATFSPELLTPEGILTACKPTDAQLKDIEFGIRITREIARLDIGQTVVVKDRAVMAVEAIEGTDEAILRGGRLAGAGAVVVKLSKPQQDMKLDVPVVGLDTLKAMHEAKAVVLAVQASRSILINRKSFIEQADRLGISVLGVSV